MATNFNTACGSNIAISHILLAKIEIFGRRIATKHNAVAAIKESIAKLGVIEPLVVRPSSKPGYFILVIGAHRAEACRQLGHETVPCIVSDADKEWSDLAEIDENLARRTLTPSERSVLTEARKKLYEKQHPETKVGAAPGKAGGGKVAKIVKFRTFAQDLAAKTGRSESGVALDAQRGRAIREAGDDAAAKIRGTSLDKGRELDALAKLPIAERARLIDRAAAGETVSAISDNPTNSNPIISVWASASTAQRTQAITHLVRLGVCRPPEKGPAA
jgi:ParB family chromosome partitioning protein